MSRCAFVLILGSVLLLGCAEEEPYAESIPPIPPGRASMPAGENGTPGYQPPAPPGR